MSNIANSSFSDGQLFHKVEKLMREDQTRVRLGFDKAAAFLNGLFCHLSSIDPVSLEDCRCDKVTLNEFNLMCTLKHLPYDQMSLEGDAKIGVVKVKLAESYSDSYDKACWEDVCTQYRGSRDRYLDTNKIRLALYRAVKTILNCENEDGASIICETKSGFITLIVNLHLNGIYRFNLLPAMWVSRKWSTLKKFDERVSHVFDTLDVKDSIECIQIVARPTATLSHTLWRITFNDLENRILNLKKFFCVQHCIFTLHSLQKKYLVSKNLPSLSLYNIRLITLREILKNPKPQEWSAEKFSLRLDSLLKSARAALEEKSNNNVFTYVNILGNCHKKDLKFLSGEFSRMRRFYKEMVLLLP